MAVDTLPATTIRPATAADATDIEALLDTCFGAARRRRTAYRLRERNAPVDGLSLVATDHAGLAGSIQYWPVQLSMAGSPLPLLLLGPIAVRPDCQGRGLALQLTAESLARADATGGPPIVLIGDPELFGRFGFDAAPTADWALPGPVERRRLLVRGGGALPIAGRLAEA